MPGIIDRTGYDYYTVSETCIFAKGQTSDAILDLKTRKIYEIQKSDFERFGVYQNKLLASGPTVDAVLDLQSGNAHNIPHDEYRIPSSESQEYPFPKATLEALMHGLDDKQIRRDEDTRVSNPTDTADLFSSHDIASTSGHIEHLCIEVTSDCNMDCIFCPKDNWFVTRTTGCRRAPRNNHSSRVLSADIWKEVLRDAANLGCTSLLIQGGEPFLRPQLTLDLLQTAQDLGLVQTKLWTNGALLSPNITDRLQMLNVNLVIQAFSLNSKSHESVSGNSNTFGNVIANIGYVAASWIPFTVVIPKCYTEGGDLDQGIEHLLEFVQDLGRHDTKCVVFQPHLNIHPLLDAHGPHSVTVTWQGDVFPCPNERLQRLGNVRKTPLPEILGKRSATGRPQEEKSLSQVWHPIGVCEDGQAYSKAITLTDRILIHLSRSVLTREVLDWVEDRLENVEDWDSFLVQARRHCLSGLIYDHFVEHRLSIPPEITSHLYWDTVAWRGRSRTFYDELALISEALAKNDLTVVLLNEPVLAKLVDFSPTKRLIRRIQLVTLPECVILVATCLMDLGHVPVVEELDAQYRDLSSEEMKDIKSRAFPDGCLMRTQVGHLVELRPSNVRIGRTDYAGIIEDSSPNPLFGPGLRVPSRETLVLNQMYEFYKHYRTGHHGGNLAGTLQQAGILKYLSEIYASLRHCLMYGSWSNLIARTLDLNFREISLYSFYYLNLFYGTGTVPENVIGELQETDMVTVPLAVNESIPVASIDDLLLSEIRTLGTVVDPALWRINCLETYHRLIEFIRDWKAIGNPYPVADCLKVNSVSRMNTEIIGKHERAILMDENQVDPNQFFLTHVTRGERPNKGIARAKLRLYWDWRALRVVTTVSAEEIHYAARDQILDCGHQVVLYVSDVSDNRIPARRLGAVIGRHGCVGPARLLPQRTDAEFYIRDISLDNVQLQATVSREQYELIFTIPWVELNVVPSVGFQFGFDIEILHRRASLNLETVLAWAGGQGLSALDSVVHGLVTLVDEGVQGGKT